MTNAWVGKTWECTESLSTIWKTIRRWTNLITDWFEAHIGKEE